MTYTTLTFAAFVVITAAIYFLFPVKKYQWTVLLAASYFFYLYNSYRYAFFIIFTTLTIYAAALRIEKIQQETKQTVKEKKSEWTREERKNYKSKMESREKKILALALILNFGILVFLKYYNFLAGGLNVLIAGKAAASGGGLPIFKLFLPLGISFYTFQSTGYLIDVKRGNVEAEHNLGKLALFISFFPQIIQGPISTFGQLEEQLVRENKLTWENFKLGSELILWGMFKKLIIADRAVTAINTVTEEYTNYTGTVILFIAILYALQLYADFSGGIDISRGVCRILGIDLIQNFRQPYFSKSINEYWRRWHISLGAWMKNYVFYTLAMSETFLNASKKMKASRFGQTPAGAHISKVLPTSIASFIVFFLVGIWHGANSRYVAFGIWNGGIIMISILLKPLYDKWISALHIKTETFGWRLFQMLRTFVLVLVGYYFDIAPNCGGAIDMMKRSLVDHHLWLSVDQVLSLGLSRWDYMILIITTLILWFISVRLEHTGLETPGDLLERRSGIVQWVVIFLTIMCIIVFGIYGPGYDPADFVYMQF